MTQNTHENPVKFLEFHVKNFKNELSQLNYSENTIKTYLREINYFIEYFREFQEEMSITDINRPFIQQSLTFREKFSKKGKISSNTKILYIKALHSFFNYLTDVMNGTVNFSIHFDKIKIQSEKKERVYLNDDEIKRLITYLNYKSNTARSYIARRNILLVKILLYTGMRITEAINLKMDDLQVSELDKNVFQIKVFGKGKKEAFCYIDRLKIEDDLEELRHFRKIYNIHSDYIFVSKSNRQITRTESYLIVRNILKKAGINKTGVHIFRHTLGYHLAQRGVRIEDIQEILRHSNINTTRIYVQRKEIDKIEGIKKIDF